MRTIEPHRCEHCGSVIVSNHRPLTQKQRALFDFLKDSIHSHGYAPSFEEIARRFGYRSLATVHEHLTTLEAKGWIRRRYNESRAIELVEAA